MQESLKTRDELLEEVAELRARLEEPEQTLSAIHSGQVDAFVVREAAGEMVYTLATSELLRQLQVITDSLPVLIAYLDHERRYRFSSRLHESWFGRPMHEITGRAMAEVTGEATYAALRARVDAVLTGQEVAFEQWLDLPVPGSRCVQVSLIPHLQGGKVQGFVTFMQDTTERRRAEEALRLLASDLEAANRAKDHFLATLSHELRTPLTPVLAMASRLQADAEMPAGLRAGVAMIRRNVELEARLIDDLLDLTRVSRGKLELHCEPTDVRQVIQTALETCDERELGERRLVEDFAAGEHRVWGEASRLSQVFWNLLNNALKFTPPGGVIHLRSYLDAPEGAAEQGASGHLVVEVADSGIGVDPEALPSIFDAFDQGEAGTGRRFGGLGLGLAISRAIVELHGGSLTAHSAGRNHGATFAVRLPLSAALSGLDRAAGAVPGSRPDAAASRPLDVLVVEDHADTAEALATLLRSCWHRVTVARTVAAALAAAEDFVPDLVVSDLGLPDGDGDDLMRALAKRHPGLRGIALSGYGMEADVARSRDAGFVLHLVKPVTLEVLLAAVEQLAV
ncbi:MAG: response regulator [Acidobacteria bacterium]|nr:response regulator [Acidobacteriota bacterium]